MTTVELRGLGKVYPDGHRAVSEVDLTIVDGELVVIVGPSGCGKTSVLRMVAGLEEISEGEIVVDGVPVGELTTNRRNLAMLFQSTALYPNMTVRDNIGFPLKMAKTHRHEIADRVERMAARLGLTDVLDDPPSQLSGGQRQRVAMGRAMVREPSLLLMDEPMSNLDAKLRTELRGEIGQMQRRLDVTTLYVTHDQLEAMSLGHRAAVMRDGRIVQCATPQELYRNPVDAFVARFIGSPPMNLVLGRVVRSGDQPAIEIGSGRVELGPTAARWPSLDRLAGRSVGVGIRPESAGLAVDGQLAVEITHTERVGAEQLVHAAVAVPKVRQRGDAVVVGPDPTSTIVARIADDVEVDRWKPVRLRVEPAELHLFDLDDGRAVAAEPIGADTLG